MASSGPPPLVKGPAGKFMEFSEGIKDNFERLYGNWGGLGNSGETTIMCPPLFRRDYVGPVGDACGATPLKDIVLDTIKGDDAEKKIFDVLKAFGEKYSQPMFVLSKLKFTKFIEYLCPGLVPQEELPRFEREVDFAIVHLQIGVILVEAKADTISPKSKGCDQLRKGEQIIRGLLPEQNRIPVFKVIALPNMDGDGFPKGDIICLKKLDVVSCNKFKHWMKKHFSEEGCGTGEKQEFLTLLHKLVAQKTVLKIFLPEKGKEGKPKGIQFSDKVQEDKELSNRLQMISKQMALEQSFESQRKQRKKGKGSGCSERPNVVKTAGTSGMADLSKQILFLNLEQISVWEGPNHQLICGVPGTGKTILLQYKALECAKKGEKVVICVPPPQDKQYEAFFAAYGISSSEVTICIFKKFYEFIPQKKENFHLFVDEAQVLNLTGLQSLLLVLLKQKNPEGCYCWLAYDSHRPFPSDFFSKFFLQYFKKHHGVNNYKDIFTKTELGRGLVFPGVEVHYFAEKLLLFKCYKFIRTILETAMRSTEEILMFAGTMCHKFYPSVLSTELHLMEKYQSGFRIGHRISGPAVEVLGPPGGKKAGIQEGSKLVEIIQTEANKTISPKKVAVLYSNHSDGENLSTILERSRIPFCAVGEKQEDSMIVLDQGCNALSFEWLVVIAVIGKGSNPFYDRIIFSRAVVKLIVVLI
ncbi:uncharacterized protein [Montipora foliosa]